MVDKVIETFDKLVAENNVQEVMALIENFNDPHDSRVFFLRTLGHGVSSEIKEATYAQLLKTREYSGHSTWMHATTCIVRDALETRDMDYLKKYCDFVFRCAKESGNLDYMDRVLENFHRYSNFEDDVSVFVDLEIVKKIIEEKPWAGKYRARTEIKSMSADDTEARKRWILHLYDVRDYYDTDRPLEKEEKKRIRQAIKRVTESYGFVRSKLAQQRVEILKSLVD